MIEQDGRVHPRPQLARERYSDLGGPWGFAYDDGGRGLDEGWQARRDVFDRTIIVPFPPESPASGIGDTGFHPVVWYRRDFHDPRRGPEERLLLHCGAVDYRARVWVNGQLVAVHEGGHTPFSADITAALRPDGRQVLVIRAEDLPADLAQPSAASRTGRPSRTRSGTTAPPASGSRSGSSRSPRRTSPGCAGPPTWTAGCWGWAVRLQRQDATPLRVRVRLRLRDTLLVDDSYTVHGRRAAAGDRPRRREQQHGSPGAAVVAAPPRT